jgi:hypothetical protein
MYAILLKKVLMNRPRDTDMIKWNHKKIPSQFSKQVTDVRRVLSAGLMDRWKNKKWKPLAGFLLKYQNIKKVLIISNINAQLSLRRGSVHSVYNWVQRVSAERGRGESRLWSNQEESPETFVAASYPAHCLTMEAWPRGGGGGGGLSSHSAAAPNLFSWAGTSYPPPTRVSWQPASNTTTTRSSLPDLNCPWPWAWLALLAATVPSTAFIHLPGPRGYYQLSYTTGRPRPE